MGTIKQDLEGNIVNKPVGMYSVVQRLKTEPERQDMAQHEDMMRRVREAEEEARRMREDLRILREENAGLGLGLCGRDGQVHRGDTAKQQRHPRPQRQHRAGHDGHRL